MAAGGDDTSSQDGAEPGVIREGKAEVLPNQSKQRKDGKTDVFYNPAQVFNRDLSVLVLGTFAKIREAEVEEKWKRKSALAQERGKPARDPPPPGLHVLEALAATGIRSIRYIKELGHRIRKIVANDLDETAVAHMRRNLAHNGVSEERVEVSCADANAHMYARRAVRGISKNTEDLYDVIDLDPYGTCAPFLDAAVQGVADGGLLCITSTDMPILGGNNPETCFARYGGAALKSGFLHEMALRLVVHAVTTTAARYGREAVPVCSCSIDFYVRVFVRVYDSAVRAKRHASKTGVVHQCVQCESFFVQPMGEIEEPAPGGKKEPKFRIARCVAPTECPECCGRMKIGGPCHIGPLHDPEFVKKCLEACTSDSASADFPGITSWKKVTGLLTAISEEHSDVVLHYKLPQLCKNLKLTPVPLKQFRGTLASLGYKVSHFHREPEAIKTDAPNAVVFDLMRLWAEENPPKDEDKSLPAVLKKEFTLKRPIEWKTEEEVSREKKVPRFLPNPEANWGPKPRARGGPKPEEEDAPKPGVAAPAVAEADDSSKTATRDPPMPDENACTEQA